MEDAFFYRRVRSEVEKEKTKWIQEHQAEELWVFALVYLYILYRGHISHYYQVPY